MSAPERGWGAAVRAWVPRWWRGEGGGWGMVLDPLLWPAEQAYRLLAASRNRAYDTGVLRARRAPIPVVSVGNLAVGGAGKTPVAAWIAARLRESGSRPAIVLRGYAEDEIQVHRELNPETPVLVGRRRWDAVLAAAKQGCDVAVVDDGFQHRALARDLDIVLVSAESWTPRQNLLPRGPWREGLTALRRADLVMVTRKSASAEKVGHLADVLARVVSDEQIVRCLIAPTGLAPLRGGPAKPLEWLDGREVLAIASLADPRPFATQLEQAGAQVELVSYPDHHSFTRSEAEQMVRCSEGRYIIMTRKEAVKLRGLLPVQTAAYFLEQRVEIESGQSAMEKALREAVAR